MYGYRCLASGHSVLSITVSGCFLCHAADSLCWTETFFNWSITHCSTCAPNFICLCVFVSSPGDWLADCLPWRHHAEISLNRLQLLHTDTHLCSHVWYTQTHTIHLCRLRCGNEASESRCSRTDGVIKTPDEDQREEDKCSVSSLPPLCTSTSHYNLLLESQ